MAYQLSFLDKIIQSTRKKVKKAVSEDPGLQEIKEKARQAPPTYDFYKALSTPPYLALIAEIKRASPSLGLMRPDLNPADQARQYQSLGASAISVITEEEFFHGALEDLMSVRSACTLPILRKDFIIHPYQVYEARAYGADAILLIAAALSEQDLIKLTELAKELDLEALVEVHNIDEITPAIKSGARIIGINNRDLVTFHVDIQTTARLAAFVPAECLLVSESGIAGIEEAREVASYGAKAILVGKALVTSPELDKLIINLTRIKCVPE